MTTIIAIITAISSFLFGTTTNQQIGTTSSTIGSMPDLKTSSIGSMPDLIPVSNNAIGSMPDL